MNNLDVKFAEYCFVFDDFPRTLKHALEFWNVYNNHLVQDKVKENDDTLDAAIRFITDYIKDNPRPREERYRYWDLKELITPSSSTMDYNSYFPDDKYTFGIGDTL